MATYKYIKNKYEFILLIVSLMMIEFVRGAFVLSYLPNLSIHPIGISLSVIGIAVSMHFIGDAISNTIGGYVMKYIGSNLVIHLSFFTSTIGLLIVSIWPNSGTILISSLLLGIGICPLWIVLLSKASGEKRGQNMSLVYLGWLIGIGAGVVAMNYLVTLNTEVILSILPILMIISWIIYGVINNGDISVHASSLKQQWTNTVQMVKQSKVVIPGILLQGIAMGMVIPILPSFAVNELHVTSNQYTLLMLLGGGSVALFLIPFGKLVDRIKNKSMVFIIGFCLFAIALFLLTVSPNLISTVVIVACLGLFYALILPAWNAFVARHIPASAKEVSWGIFSAIQGLGVMIGPLIGSALTLQNNSGTTIIACAAIFGLTAVIYFFHFLDRHFKGKLI